MAQRPPQDNPPTESQPPDQGGIPTIQPDAGSMHASGIDDGRFTAGTVLAERYRIVGRIGRGGMGEVYRADDLKLGQSVALKFLPEAMATDAAWLRRLHDGHYGDVRLIAACGSRTARMIGRARHLFRKKTCLAPFGAVLRWPMNGTCARGG